MNQNLGEPSPVPTYSSALDLRSRTQAAHRAVEQALSLPSAIQTLDDYRRWLIRFFGIYAPLELRLAEYTDWPAWGIQLNELGHSDNLRKDLVVLGIPIPGIQLASLRALPVLNNFAQAFGALYVIEGSKLGGGFMLNDFSGRLSPGIDDANAFFRGHGLMATANWSSFKERLDKFLTCRPVDFEEVANGAEATFESIRLWMSSPWGGTH